MNLRLHDFELSGHSYRVRLFLSLLDLPYTAIAVDLPAGAHKTPQFLRLNALYSYTAVAPEGNVSLDAYANIRRWLAHIESLPGFIPMPRSNIGLYA